MLVNVVSDKLNKDLPRSVQLWTGRCVGRHPVTAEAVLNSTRTELSCAFLTAAWNWLYAFCLFHFENQRSSSMWHETTWLKLMSLVCMPPDVCQYVCFVVLGLPVCYLFLWLYFLYCMLHLISLKFPVLKHSSSIVYIYTANAKISLPQSAAIVYLCILYWGEVCALLIMLLM